MMRTELLTGIKMVNYIVTMVPLLSAMNLENGGHTEFSTERTVLPLIGLVGLVGDGPNVGS
ncbi:hypothetical protein B0T41_18605 [Chromobacterium violaceum]|nr:hypothetical protein B0T41_18605 [Chromobacterium violaceum]